VLRGVWLRVEWVLCKRGRTVERGMGMRWTAEQKGAEMDLRYALGSVEVGRELPESHKLMLRA